jgi:flagellar hook-associated protein 1 FlgK
MSNGIYGIGLSGLAAAQAGLLTAGHNIANVNTPGYSRQEILQTTQLPLFTGAGFFGAGTNVAAVRRVYSEFLVARHRQVAADAAQLDAYHAQIKQVDNLFGAPETGLSPALASFFAGVNGVAAHPSDVASRSQMLSSATGLVARFRGLATELERMRAGANTEVRNSVNSINGYASQIASLNRRIAEASAANANQPANDLLDQRDALIGQLNQVIGARAITQTDGSANVFLSNGQALVIGVSSFALKTTPDAIDPGNLQVALDTGGGTFVQFRTSDVVGGALAGVLSHRDSILTRAENEIGRIALALGAAFNAQHRLGQDLKGAAGTDFFSVPSPMVQAALTNTGSAAIDAAITSASAVAASDYQLAFDGTNYTVTRQSDGTVQTFAALPRTVDGVTISVASGAMAAGDTFLIQPTRYAARDIGVAIGDPTRIAAATPIRTSATVANAGSGVISGGTIDASYLTVPLASPLALTYSAATGTLSGFPAAAPVSVTVGTTTTVYPAGTPVPYASGATIAFGGVSFTLTGTIADGDTFTIGPNTSGTGDNRNAQLLASLNEANLVAGTATLGSAYGQMTAFVGTTTQGVGVESEAQAELLAHADAALQSISGVNLDEEAANLQKYQQAYQAAGKVMAIANSLFDSILEIARS